MRRQAFAPRTSGSVLLMIVSFIFPLTGLAATGNEVARYQRSIDESQYLIFAGSADIFMKDGKALPLEDAISVLETRLGKNHNPRRLWGVAVMLETWQADPKELASMVGVFTSLAIKREFALQFIVDSLEWGRRPELWNWYDPSAPGYDPDNRNNVEWTDWQGSPNLHRYRNWGKPEKLAPVMAYNSPRVLDEVSRRIREVVGPVILSSRKRMQEANKAYLFAGVTVGAETELPDYSLVSRIDPAISRAMDEDHAPKLMLGYNALTHLGYSKEHPPENFKQALAQVNQQFIAYWARALAGVGLPKEKLYTHIPVGDQVVMVDYIHAPIDIAFNDFSRPGWTLYPIGPFAKNFLLLYEILAKHGSPVWAATEANPSMLGSGRLDMEEYLKRFFDYGAAVVVLNSGATSADLQRQLSDAMWGPEALAAYGKFLRGEQLSHNDVYVAGPDEQLAARQIALKAKLEKVQAGIKLWQSEKKDPTALAKLLNDEFMPLVQAGKIDDADAVLEKVLKLLGNTEK